jgi:hypothetical protein
MRLQARMRDWPSMFWDWRVATPMGMTVTFEAEVIGVEGRRVNFKMEAWDEKEKCGEGAHERAIVNIARFAAKMQGRQKTGVGRQESEDRRRNF